MQSRADLLRLLSPTFLFLSVSPSPVPSSRFRRTREGGNRDHPSFPFIGSPFLLLVNRKRTYTRWPEVARYAYGRRRKLQCDKRAFPFIATSTSFGRHDWNSNVRKVYFLSYFCRTKNCANVTHCDSSLALLAVTVLNINN